MLPYTVVLGDIGRPIAPAGTVVAYYRKGIVYMDVVRATRTFDGLLTLSHGDRTVTVTIARRTATFRVGSSIARLNGAPWRLPGAPFVESGDIFVPLSALAHMAGAGLKVDTKQRIAEIDPGTPPPPPEQAPSASESLAPSPAQALSLTPSATVDVSGLHARLEIVNVTSIPYTLTFTSGAQVAFIVSKDGLPVWNSLHGQRFTQSLQSVTLAPRARHSITADWTGFNGSGPGRYTMRARVLTTAPFDTSSISLGVFTPAPSPS